MKKLFTIRLPIPPVLLWTTAALAASAVLLLAIPFGAQASFTTGASSATTLSKGLVGYWTFDGKDTNWNTNKTNDLSGQGNTGTLVSMSTTTSPVPGKIGQGLKFVVTNYVSATGPSLGSNSVTVSAWIYPRAFLSTTFSGGATNDGFQIFTTRTLSADKSPTLLVYGTKATFVFDSAGVGVGATGATTLVVNKWYHVVGVFNYTGAGSFGGTWDVYVNGVKDNSSSNNFALAGSASFPFTGTPYIGNFPQWPSTPQFSDGSNGLIDDVRIYNRALSAGEVKELYNVGKITKDASPVTSLKTGLVGYWTFDGKDTNWATGKTNDLSGSGNTGTLVSMSTTTSPVSGKIGQGLKFDGVNDYVSPPTSGLPYGTGAKTMCGWGKTNTTGLGLGGLGYAWIAAYGSGSNTNAFFIGRHNTDLVGGGYGGAGVDVTVANFWTPGIWHHICLTYNGTTASLYSDGILRTSGARSWNTVQSLAYIGQQVNTSNEYWDGSIDDVRIYNRALSAGEVAQLYAMGKITKDTSPVNTLKTGLVGYWTFDGKNVPWTSATAATALDSSGQGNTGTLTSMNQKTSPTAGKIGQGLKFDGTTQYVRTTTSPSTPAIVSTSFWMKANTLVNYEPLVDQWDESTTKRAWSVSLFGDGRIYAYNSTDGSNFSPISSSILSINKWYFITIVFDTSNASTGKKIYINGVLDVSGAESSIFSTTEPISIGHSIQQFGGTNYYFNGAIDDVRIYNRALSANEVKQLYNIGR